MVDILSMVDLTSISAMLAAIGVLVGVVFAILELRNLVRTRQTDVVMRLYSIFSSREFQEVDLKVTTMEFEDYTDFVKKYGSSPSEKSIHTAIRMVGAFFEGIGVLLHRKLVDIGLISDLFSVQLRWEKMKPIAEGIRKHFNDPRLYEWFEYLYNELQKREQTLEQIPQ